MFRVMLTVLAVVALAAAVPQHMYANKRLFKGDYMKTPNGLILSECVHNVPSGSVVHVKQTYTDVSLNGEVLARIPHCDTRNNTVPMLVADNRDLPSSSPDVTLPADYDGWEEYTAWHYPQGLDSFNGYFSVPDAPAEDPDILYLFTGLQNIDWIPKVDPMPTDLFDIIQPVLQYPADGTLSEWSVKSWFVSLQAGAFYSDQLIMQPGDKVFGIMEREAPQQFLVSSIRASDQKSTVIHPKNERLVSQPWAYNTLEGYGLKGCGTYPTKPCEFTQLAFGAAPGNVTVKATWVANPTPAEKQFCTESLKIQDSATVTISFTS